MGFSKLLKEDVLVRSARRCCVCREYKGLYIEVHHIVAEAKGGKNTLENAIALCFDCHGAAGHYNTEHPIGNKFSPKELRRHRDAHWVDVAAGRFPTLPSSIASGIHVRHLVSLDDAQTREILTGTLQNNHFLLDQVIPTSASKFMEAVLSDELPAPLARLTAGGVALPGTVSQTRWWKTRSDLVAEFPEFERSDERPANEADFSGVVQSKLLQRCVAEGFPAAGLGLIRVHHNLCGEESWSTSYLVRRPLYVFTIIENRGPSSLVIDGFTCEEDRPDGVAARAVATSRVGSGRLEAPPITLVPGAGIVVPTGVLLSPIAHDDLSIEWMDLVPPYGDLATFTALSDPDARMGPAEYLQVGPRISLAAMNVVTQEASAIVEVRPFDVRRVYLLGKSFMVGSCPYAVVELDDGTIEQLGEILVGAWKNEQSEHLVMPHGARWLHICEFEHETTIIESVQIDGAAGLEAPVSLERGDCLRLKVDGRQTVVVRGMYDCAFPEPSTEDQRRMQRSLACGGLRVLAKRLGARPRGGS